MHAPSGKIIHLDEESQESFSVGTILDFESEQARLLQQLSELHDLDKDELIPLSKDENRILSNVSPKARKGWMRNKPCICGSGKKFKKCCWSKHHKNTRGQS